MTKNAKATAVRLFRRVNQTKIKLTWFITLTIPANENPSAAGFKKILERYFASLLRMWGDRLWWYWAMEPTASGTWHAHLIACWVGEPPTWKKFVAWNDLAWHRSTRSPNPAHLRSGCRVEVARTWHGVTKYLSGYLSPAKWAAYSGPPTGRVHGARNRSLIPIDAEKIVLTPLGEKLLRRAVAKIRGRRASGAWFVDLKPGPDGKPIEVKRSKMTRLVDAGLGRRRSKMFAREALTSGWAGKVKIVRRRGRFFHQQARWNRAEEYAVDRHGREKFVGFVFEPDGVESVGPNDLHLPHAQALRLVEWAHRESLRREEFENACPF